MKNRGTMVGILILLSVCAREVWADFKPQPLTVGMSQEDVLSIWGEPLEREERETKREATWLYPGRAMVAFAHGRVADWNGGAHLRSAIPLTPAMTAAIDSKTGSQARTAEPNVTADDMQDILDAIATRGSETEAPAGRGPK